MTPPRTTPVTTDEAAGLVRAALRHVAPGPGLDELADDADLRDELELDSLDFLAFVRRLVADTGVRIEEDDYPRLATVASAAGFLATASRTG